jgi:hypothetical protein
MRAEQWRKAGYRVLFTGRGVIVYDPKLDHAYYTAIKRGDWTKHDDLKSNPWALSLDPAVYRWIKAVLADCYCTPCTTCDYCAGLRDSPTAKANKILVWIAG